MTVSDEYVTLFKVNFADQRLHQTNFVQPFDLQFVSINGSIGPNPRTSSGTPGNFSGAYLGGDGRDQFYVLNSNISRGTPLPPWTDANFFYLPTIAVGDANSTRIEQFQIDTTALGAELGCNVMKTTDARIKIHGQGTLILNMTVERDGIRAECSSQRGDDTAHVMQGPTSCQTGASALELVVELDALHFNATQEEKDVCLGTVILAWARKPQGTCTSSSQPDFDATNSLFVQCQPRLVRGKSSPS